MVIIHYMKLLPNLSECARHQLIFFFFFFGIKHPANPLLLEQGLKGLILNFTLTRIKRKLKPKELFSLKQTSIPCMAAIPIMPHLDWLFGTQKFFLSLARAFPCV